MFLPNDIINLISSFVCEYELRDWISCDKLDWMYLSSNPAASHLLEQNREKIHWDWLSSNSAAIHLCDQNKDKIDWDWLSLNPAAIDLLQGNRKKINCVYL